MLSVLVLTALLGQKVSDLPALTTPDAADYANILDVSDTSIAATGRQKKVLLSDLAKGLTATNLTTGTLAVANGGTGQTSYTNGQLLIGNTSGNTLTKATLTGTSNQITVTNGGGSITLSTPQDIGTASNVQFTKVGVGRSPSAVLDAVGTFSRLGSFFVEPIGRLVSNNAAAVDDGAPLMFGGESGNGSTPYHFAIIRGAKESATPGSYAGYFAIHTVAGSGTAETNSGDYERVRVTSTGTVGIGTTGPDAALDVLRTTEQLRLSYTDGVTYTSFTVDSGGDLTIAPTGGDVVVAGSAKSNNATAGIGYATGAGGTVTQTTNRSTGVTLNKVCGTITTDTTSLAGLASASFTVTNSAVAIGDTILLSIRSGATNTKTHAIVSAVAAGSFQITIHNLDPVTAEVGAIIINFAVVKATTS